jgi:MFS family permease
VTSSTSLARRRAAALLAYTIGGMLASTWGPRLPDLTRELHVTTSEIGVVLAAPTVGLLVGLLVASAVARFRGARRGIRASLVALAIFLAAGAAAISSGSAPVLSGLLILVGLATGVLDVLINTEGSSIEQHAGKTFLPLLHAMWLGGAALGAALGALCAALGITVAAQAALLAGLVLLATPPIVRWLPEAARHDGIARAPDRVGFHHRIQEWGQPRLIALGVLVFGVELAEGSARTWMPLAAVRELHQSDAMAALLVTVFSVTTAGFRALGGPAVDRLGRVAVVRVTLAVGAVGVTLFILGGSTAVVLIGTLLWAIGNCVAGPLALSAAAEGGGDAAGRIGVVSTIGFAAGLAGPPLIGILAHQSGLIPSLWAAVVAFSLAFVVSGALRSPNTPALA